MDTTLELCKNEMTKITRKIRLNDNAPAPLSRGAVIVKPVTTEEELVAVFKLRYHIYCLEKGFENPDDFPSGLEIDQYDPYAVHLLAYSEHAPIGTARLILPNQVGLPVEHFCKVDVYDVCSTDKVAEISRLAVSTEMTRRYSIDRSKVMLGLIRHIYSVADNLNVMFCFAAMRKALERLLRNCGINFIRAGNPVDYHGIRVPYYTAVADFEKDILLKSREIYEIMFPQDRNSYPLLRLDNCFQW